MKKLICFLLIFFITFLSKSFAQNFNKDSLLGLWVFRVGDLYSSREFVNDSTLIVSSSFSISKSTYKYVLDTSNPDHIIMIEIYKDPDSITTVQSRLQMTKNDELIVQTLKIKHFNTLTEAWGESSLPADALTTYKRAKK
jgi:hypothetical protein